jgi:WD40 repeat protein
MILGHKRLVKCCLTDGSILKDYTSMIWDAKLPTGIPVEIWHVIGPKSPEENQISEIAATSDHKWLFVACNKGWWAIIDLQQDKCVSRKHCRQNQDGQFSSPNQVAVSPDDQLFYMVTTGGTVEKYDIQAAKDREVKFIPNQSLMKIIVDPNNQFVFITSESGNLYKYDTG